MNKKELEEVHNAIRKRGDGFWNDVSEWGRENAQDPDKHWNGYLFNEVVAMLKEEGYDLKLVKL